MEYKELLEKITTAYLGSSFADGYSLGFEFYSADYIKDNFDIKGLTEPIGYLMHNQPPLTFSDDSSLLFCLTESLIKGYNLKDITHTFSQWYNPDIAYWAARGTVFDVGMTFAKSMERYLANKSIPPVQLGDDSFYSNGNSGLSRSLALVFYTLGMPLNKIFHYTKQVSSITHRHPISIITAFYYVVYVQHILQMDKLSAYDETNRVVKEYLQTTDISKDDVHTLHRVLDGQILHLPENEVQSSSFCVHTLECSLWAVFKSNSYRETLDTVILFGEDVDSNCYLASSISSLIWGLDDVKQWLPQLARFNDIVDIAKRFTNILVSRSQQ